MVGILNGRGPQNAPTSPWGATDANQSNAGSRTRNLPHPQCRDDQTSCVIGLAPTSNEPENQVAEFIDPRSLSQTLIESIQEARHNAEQALQNVEALSP